MTEPVHHADGIYFGMSEAEYFADPALGSTDMRMLATKPCQWQWARMFPEPDTDTPDTLFGSALHCAVLEGMDALHERFPILMDQRDYPNALRTQKEMLAFAERHGYQIRKSASKPDMIAALREHDPDVLIWEDAERQYYDGLPAGARPIKREVWEQIRIARQYMTQHPALGSAVKGGLAEVSVFWTGEDGVRRRARFDYLKAGTLTDIKSITTSWMNDNIEHIIGRAIDKYQIQAAHYIEARDQMEDFVFEGAVHGLPERVDPEWIERVASRQWTDDTAKAASGEGWSYTWIFYEKEGAPLSYGKVLARDVLNNARSWLSLARDNYAHFMSKYGEGEIWIPENPITHVTMDDLPPWSKIR